LVWPDPATTNGAPGRPARPRTAGSCSS
jgi:hypothetical protein